MQFLIVRSKKEAWYKKLTSNNRQLGRQIRYSDSFNSFQNKPHFPQGPRTHGLAQAGQVPFPFPLPKKIPYVW